MNLLDKIKKHGVAGSLRIARQYAVDAANNAVFRLCKCFPINPNRIVLESEGDLSDNAYALYEELRRSGSLDRYQVVWLVDHVAEARSKVGPHTRCCVKRPASFRPVRSYLLATCRWYLYDHCNMMASLQKRPGQTVVYLSHGWGYKSAKGTDPSRDRTRPDYLTATGPLSAKGLAQYWQEPEEKVLITGYPRIDYFYRDDPLVRETVERIWHFGGYRKVFFWMPTFRQCRNSALSEDYLTGQTGLPLFETAESLAGFSDFLQKNNILLIFKLHHLQAELPVFRTVLPNITIIRDGDLVSAGLQLYQFLPFADAVISDYSSVTIDCLPLGKPLIYTLDDYAQYDRSRGLFPKNAVDYMPGHHVYSVAELECSILEICGGADPYRADREKILPCYHTYRDGHAARRVFHAVGIDTVGK